MPAQTILIAERQTHVVDALTIRLRSAGFLVMTAADGAEAYALAISLRPDLIVADYQMPRLSGPELCVRLAHDPLTAHIPVVLMTVNGVDPSAIAASNIACIVPKPIRPHLLLEIVQDLLAEPAAV